MKNIIQIILRTLETPMLILTGKQPMIPGRKLVAQMPVKTSGKQLMKKGYALLMLLMLTVNLIYADTINEQKANLVAVNFLKSKTGTTELKAILHYKQVEPNGNVDFYVFNFLARPGFVIVTADNNLEPVIAYSTESHFDISIADKIGISDWMSDTQKQIQEAVKLNVKADMRISNLWSAYLSGANIVTPQSAQVGPLLTSRWSQGYEDAFQIPYYYSLCPFDAGANLHCVTGCVATAMAQIMKYWNYPLHGIGTHSYSCNYGNQFADFGNTTYNWLQMPDELTLGSPNAVDVLMYHCGVAVEMDYGVTSSGANTFPDIWGHANAQEAYVNNFGYRNTIQQIQASNYSQSQWIALLKSELDAKRPIQYRGAGSGAHTWVCDGYDVNDMFDMNWGWGGVDNGYFALTNLYAGGQNFNSGHKALICIWPGDLSDCNSNWNLSGIPMYNRTWQASDYIVSTQDLYPALNYTIYTAANQIILNPGFHARNNSTFTAKIQPCITFKIGEDPKPESIEKGDEKDLTVYPNPFSDNLTIQFNLSKDDNATIKLFDIMGKEIKTISNSFLTEGKHDISMDATDLPGGIYFLVLQSGDARMQQKIIKVN